MFSIKLFGFLLKIHEIAAKNDLLILFSAPNRNKHGLLTFNCFVFILL